MYSKIFANDIDINQIDYNNLVILFLTKLKCFYNQILKSDEKTNSMYIEKYIKELLKNMVNFILINFQNFDND